MPLSHATTERIARALELVPRGVTQWEGARREVPVELDASGFHPELRLALRGPTPEGFAIHPRRQGFGRAWDERTPFRDVARCVVDDPNDLQCLIEDDALQSSIQELFTFPGSWIGRDAVYVRPSDDLTATRHAVDVAAVISQRLSALFAADAQRPVLGAETDPPVPEGSSERPGAGNELMSRLAGFNRGLHVFLDLCCSALNLVLWTNGDGYAPGGLWAARLCGLGLLFAMLGIDLSNKRTPMRKLSVAVLAASCLLAGAVALIEGAQSSAWIPLAAAAMFGVCQLFNLFG